MPLIPRSIQNLTVEVISSTSSPALVSQPTSGIYKKHIAKKALQSTDLAFSCSGDCDHHAGGKHLLGSRSTSTTRTSRSRSDRSLCCSGPSTTTRSSSSSKAIAAMQVIKDQSGCGHQRSATSLFHAPTFSLRPSSLSRMPSPRPTTLTIDEMLASIPLDSQRLRPTPNAAKSIGDLIDCSGKRTAPDVEAGRDRPMEVAQDEPQIHSSAHLLPTLNAYNRTWRKPGTAGPKESELRAFPRGSQYSSDLPVGFGGMLDNTFNYSSPEYQVGMALSINLRNQPHTSSKLWSSCLNRRGSTLSAFAHHSFCLKLWDTATTMCSLSISTIPATPLPARRASTFLPVCRRSIRACLSSS